MTDPSPSPVSSARVPTDRAGRYGKQLVAHLSRRSSGAWDDTADRGWISMGSGRVELAGGPESLDIELRGAEEDVERLEDVVGRHLVRFGARDELVVAWVRADGTPGTEQRNSGE
jgi:hypothetical protein